MHPRPTPIAGTAGSAQYGRKALGPHRRPWGNGHHRRVLVEYMDFYNRARPHQGIEQGTPDPPGLAIGRREVLGGVIHDYFRQARLTAWRSADRDFSPHIR